MARLRTKEKRGIVAIDFDGVIGDSAHEVYIQSLKAYKGIGGKLEHSPALEKLYRTGRPLITRVEQIFTIFRLMQEHPGINFNQMHQEKFDAEFNKDKEKAQEFQKMFYEHRKQMQGSSYASWVKLQKSFPKIAWFIKRLKAGNEVYVASTKDLKSVMELFNRYGIKLPEKNLVTLDFSKDKKEQLREIARRSGRPLGSIVLIDDALEQVRGARAIGARGIFSPTGYSTPLQKKLARGERFPSLSSGRLTRRDLMKVNRAARRA